MINVKFNDKAKQVLADTLDLSGSIVVNELPQVGEKHTIYELHTTTPSKFNYVPCGYTDVKIRYVFENEEAFREFIRNFAKYYKDHNEFYCYCLAEDELIEVYYSSGSAYWTLFDKEEENVFIYNNQRVCICKALIDEHTALLLNGKQVHIGDNNGILYSTVFLHQVKSMILCNKGKFGMILPIINNSLPSCVDGIPSTLFMPFVFCSDPNSGIVQWVTNDGSIKVALPYVDGKYRYDKNAQHFYDAKTGEYYTGKFEWVDIEDFNFKKYADYETYDTIPLSEGAMDKPFIFDPSEKLIISYWIYTKGEWVNVDKIGEPNTITIPVSSVRSLHPESVTELIKLSKIHFYLDNKELDLIPIQTEEQWEDCGYLVVPLLDSDDATYHLHIVFDSDVVFGSGGDITTQSIFRSDRQELQLTNGITEYDFDIYVGSLSIFCGE